MDSNGEEAGKGNAKEKIGCKNRAERDRLPFDISYDIMGVDDYRDTVFKFTLNWWMPNHCQPQWWTEQQKDGGNQAGAHECYGYPRETMHCDSVWDKDKGYAILSTNNHVYRQFDCYFTYLGSGGDKAPPGSRRSLAEVEAPVKAIVTTITTVLEAVPEGVVTEVAGEISPLKRGRGALDRH
jgi:hypothetical protein